MSLPWRIDHLDMCEEKDMDKDDVHQLLAMHGVTAVPFRSRPPPVFVSTLPPPPHELSATGFQNSDEQRARVEQARAAAERARAAAAEARAAVALERAKLDSKLQLEREQHRLQLERELALRKADEERERRERERDEVERLVREQRLLEERQTERLKAEAKLADNIDKLECSVCLSAVASHVMDPCGHLCVCGDCVGEIVKRPCDRDDDDSDQDAVGAQKCPICRAAVRKAIRVFV